MSISTNFEGLWDLPALPNRPTEAAYKMAQGEAFGEGYRSSERANPYPAPDRPTPEDPHVQFAFGESRRDYEKSKDRPFNRKPRASRHKVGKGRWFWITAGDWRMWWFCTNHGVDALRHGIEATAEDAVKAAREVYPDAHVGDTQARDAKIYWKMLKALERQKSTTSVSEESQKMKFVYCVQTLLSHSKPFLKKHRHIKSTPKRIFVAKERWKVEQRRREGQWRNYHTNRLSLDREEMKKEGFVERKDGYGVFLRYFMDHEDAKEYMKRGANGRSTLPNCFRLLGVDSDATREDIKVAFRERAKTKHPDKGGDPQAFRELRAAYEDALCRV